MPREHAQLTAAKKSYGNAKAVGNHEEEARWANAIGDMLKKRGEYVAALQWLRIDYDLSVKYLPQKHCLPTCQSLGELYLRLECFKEALIYQGQALAKVNIGDVLDSVDNFKGALDAFGSGGNGSDLIIWQIRLDPRISNTT